MANCADWESLHFSENDMSDANVIINKHMLSMSLINDTLPPYTHVLWIKLIKCLTENTAEII